MSCRYPPGPALPRPSLSLRSWPSSGRVRVEVTGELDLLTTPIVVAVIDAVVRVHQPTVVELDLTDLSFLSTCGVTALVDAANRLDAAGRRLVVTHPHGTVLRVLTITRTLDFLHSPSCEPGGIAGSADRQTGNADTDDHHLLSTVRAFDDQRPSRRQRHWQAVNEQLRS